MGRQWLRWRPSWLSFIGHAKDSLHSLDPFRSESVALRTYWVLVVMDQYTRRIIGFGIMPESWMGAQCVGCSIEQCDGSHCGLSRSDGLSGGASAAR